MAAAALVAPRRGVVVDEAGVDLELLKQVKKIKNSLTSAKTQIDSGASAVDEMAAAVRLQLERIAELTVPGEAD